MWGAALSARGRTLLSGCVIVMAVTPAFALRPNLTGETDAEAPSAAQPGTPAERGTMDSAEKREASPAAGKGHTPSERIKADSAVSFPVDI